MGKLIVTADDFGAHPYIDKGITKAVLAGCVNTVSVMMTFEDPIPKVKKLISEAQNANRELCLGVHISLTAGTPVLTDEAFTLTYDGGKFMDINKYNYDQVDPVEVYNEVHAQVQLFKDQLGIVPDHLTCHHGIMYLFPDYFKIYLKVAREFGVPVRNPILISSLGVKAFRRSFMRREGLYRGYQILKSQGKEQAAISLVNLSHESLTNKMKVFNDGFVTCPHYFIDTLYKNGTEKQLKKILKNLPRQKTSELVVHLGEGEYETTTSELKKYNGISLDYFPGRQDELKAIVSNHNLGERIKNDIKLGWAKFSDFQPV